MPAGAMVYASLGREMQVYGIDVATGALTPAQSLIMPQTIQYAWPNRARTLLYVGTSGAGPMATVKVQEHYVQVFSILRDGRLAALAPPTRLANRPLHLSLDGEEQHMLIACNDPPGVTVHAIRPGGDVGEQIAQEPLEFGPTVHQVRVTPAGNVAIVPCCAHHTEGALAGSVALFSYTRGKLAPLARIEADPERAIPWRGVRNGAHGFAARHVDFHPTRPWMYLGIETQGELRLHDLVAGGVALKPRAIVSTLDGVPRGRSSQMSSAVHVHPNGRFVYVTNRAWDTETVDGRKVFVGGLNDVAVFAIDEGTGAPTLIQHAETQGIFPRTFGIDASGRVLVVGNQEPYLVREGSSLRKVLPSLAVFRIGADGRLTMTGRHDLADNGEVCFWTGVVTLQEG